MNSKLAADLLASLALEARLDVFRLLVKAGPQGVKAGDIALALGAHASTLSANLAVLSHAGLIEGRREGRAIFYSARYDRMRDLMAYLLDDCCNGAPEVCAPLVDIANRAACCGGAPASEARP